MFYIYMFLVFIKNVFDLVIEFTFTRVVQLSIPLYSDVKM